MDTVTEAGMAIAMAVSAAPRGGHGHRAGPLCRPYRDGGGGDAVRGAGLSAQASPQRSGDRPPPQSPGGESGMLLPGTPRGGGGGGRAEPAGRDPVPPGGGRGGPALRARRRDPPGEGPGRRGGELQ